MGSTASKQEDDNDADSKNPDNKQLQHDGWDSLSEKKRGYVLILIQQSVLPTSFMTDLLYCLSVVGEDVPIVYAW